MSLRIGDIAPDFEADTTGGRIRFHDWIGSSWAILFSHPKDFTPICTTELGAFARLKPEFDRRNVKLIGLSVDPVEDHRRWAEDIARTQGAAPNYPIIGDHDLKVAKLYGMLPAEAEGGAAGRSPADNQTVRTVFIIGPDKRIRLMMIYPMTIGRNMDEILRVVDALQFNERTRLATPVNWRPGDEAVIPASIPDEEAKRLFPQGFRALTPYLRLTKVS